MTEPSGGTWTLRARYPLPDWTVDSEFKRELTLVVADAISEAVECRPDREGPRTAQDHAERVTRAVRKALEPCLSWLDDSITDGFSYPGDVLVSYISQLALTRPGETLDPEHYRELLRAYSRHLVQRARDFPGPAAPSG